MRSTPCTTYTQAVYPASQYSQMIWDKFVLKEVILNRAVSERRHSSFTRRIHYESAQYNDERTTLFNERLNTFENGSITNKYFPLRISVKRIKWRIIYNSCRVLFMFYVQMVVFVCYLFTQHWRHWQRSCLSFRVQSDHLL